MCSILEQARHCLRLAGTVFDSTLDLYRLPCPSGYPLIGHLPYLLRPDYHVQLLEWADQCGGIYRFCVASQWVVIVTDGPLARQVLGRGAGGVARKSIGYQFFDLATNNLGRDSMFSTRDEARWGVQRKTLAAAFSASNIRRTFPYVLQRCQKMSRTLLSSRQPVDVQTQCELLMLDVFVQSFFDTPAEQLPGVEVVHAMSVTLNEANRRLTMPLRPLVQALLQPQHARRVSNAQQVLAEVYAMLVDGLQQRCRTDEAAAASSSRLWACLGRLRHAHTGALLTREELIPEVGALMMAGFDTTSQSLIWCLATIASHPDVQQRIHAELAAAGLLQASGRPARDLAYDDLPQLSYLLCVIDETMRMYPVAASASVRELASPTRIGDYVLPRGVMVWPLLYGLHNSTRNWLEPRQFRPERWYSRHGVSAGTLRSQAELLNACSSGREVVDKCTGAAAASGISNGAAKDCDRSSNGTTHCLCSSNHRLVPAACQPAAAAAALHGTSAAANHREPADSEAGGQAGLAGGSGKAAAADEERWAAQDAAFMPFSDGVKGCLGQGFGRLVVRAALAVLLSQARVELAPGMVVRDDSMSLALTLNLTGGLHLVFRPLA